MRVRYIKEFYINSFMANQKWEVSIKEFKSKGTKRYKVTRRMHDLSVSETKVFISKKKALKQLEEWLS